MPAFTPSNGHFTPEQIDTHNNTRFLKFQRIRGAAESNPQIGPELAQKLVSAVFKPLEKSPEQKEQITNADWYLAHLCDGINRTGGAPEFLNFVRAVEVWNRADEKTRPALLDRAQYGGTLAQFVASLAVDKTALLAEADRSIAAQTGYRHAPKVEIPNHSTPAQRPARVITAASSGNGNGKGAFNNELRAISRITRH
jgi:hypothetical protein